MKIRFTLISLVLITLAGCSGPAIMTVNDMTATDYEIGYYADPNVVSPMRHSVRVGTVLAANLPRITPRDGHKMLAKALRESLDSSYLLASSENTAKYELTATLFDVKLDGEPEYIKGTDVYEKHVKITTSIQYRLMDLKSGKVVFYEKIMSDYTAIGAPLEPLRHLATKKSIRFNFVKLITKLHQLKLEAA